jgi:uncharacterized protein YjbI with pentapeptide repeats
VTTRSAPEPSLGRRFEGDDWYAEELGAAAFRDCTFVDVDLTEASTQGATFERCRFERCRFNASRHIATSYVACDSSRFPFLP